jgi:hypothetical protein
MSLTKKSFLAAVLLAAAVFAAAAAADHGGRSHEHGSHEHGKLLRAHLVGSILSDPPIHGVTRGGAPWVGTGTATLDRHGRFKVRIRGLVIPSLGNPGPVTSLKFSLFCAPEASGPVFMTGSTPLSAPGECPAAAARDGSTAVSRSGGARAPERDCCRLHRGFWVLGGKADELVLDQDELVPLQCSHGFGVH